MDELFEDYYRHQKTNFCEVTENAEILAGFLSTLTPDRHPESWLEWLRQSGEKSETVKVDEKTYSSVPVPTPHGKKRRIVYRGEVYNALESARINSLDGILLDPYKEGFHDGLKRAIQILVNEVKDASTIIPAEEES